jgi:hypothetical protein
MSGLMTPAQRAVVEKLCEKGWIDPWMYRRCVHLFLPRPAWFRRAKNLGIYRDYSRPGVRVTPTGRVLANADRTRKEETR